MNRAQYHREKVNHRKPTLALMLFVAGLVTGFIGIFLFIHDRQTIPKPPSETVQSSPAPSSVKPAKKEVDTYTVAPTLPKFLNIPAINISQARIYQLGLTKDNQIAAPSNIYDAGWYNNSNLPGQIGAMFIYGHVSSWQANGLFYNLKKLKIGDTVTVIRGDNTTFTYQVESTKIYPFDQVNMNQVLAPIDPSKPGLNLMTCTGQVIKDTSEFNERLVVFTSLVN